MYTLGINSIYHDSAACLVKDGIVIAAVEEERFSRVRHQKRGTAYEAHALPFHSIDYCLQEAGILLSDVDQVAYSFNPFYLVGPANQTQVPGSNGVWSARAGRSLDPGLPYRSRDEGPPQ